MHSRSQEIVVQRGHPDLSIQEPGQLAGTESPRPLPSNGITERPGQRREMESGAVFIGIDVSKAHLDVAALPGDEVWREGNAEEGIARLVKGVKSRESGILVVLEATGVWSWQ